MKKFANTWTDEEVEILIAKYPYMSAQHVQQLIPRHTVHAIHRKANLIDLRVYKRKEDYSAYLYAAAGRQTPITEICRHMQCSRSSAYRRMRLLGISTFNSLSL
jgi:NADH:ubiquinone oxidoreductase subunit E